MALVLAAAFAVLWTGPPASAAAGQAGARSQLAVSPARVKYYIVPPAPAESLFQIAVKTLGDGNRDRQILRLNRGRLQPGGGRLENTHLLKPGWILRLPPDAAGPGVHFGVLPAATQAAASPSTAATPANSASTAFSGAGRAAMVLVVVTAAIGLIGLFWHLRRPRRRPGFRRRRADPWDAGREAGLDDAGAQDAAAFWLPPAAESGWSGWDAPPPALHPDHPSAPFPRIQVRDERRGRDDGWGPAGGWKPGGEWSPDAGRDYGRTQAVLTRPERTGSHQVVEPEIGGRPGLPFAEYDPAGQGEPGPWNDGEFRAADSLWVARRVLSEADERALEITLRAETEVSELRAAAQRDADEIRQQAAGIKQKASGEAAAIVAAAEAEADRIRAAVMTMSADLGQVAAYVTENLTMPVMPALQPLVRPSGKTATRPAPADEPAARPGTRPATKLASRPQARPAAKPSARPRQHGAMRIFAGVVAALVLLALTAGLTELGLHGYPFFVFRSAGNGVTPTSGLKEDQGPGQPDAPRTHISKVPASRPSPRPKPSTSAGGSRG